MNSRRLVAAQRHSEASRCFFEKLFQHRFTSRSFALRTPLKVTCSITRRVFTYFLQTVQMLCPAIMALEFGWTWKQHFTKWRAELIYLVEFEAVPHKVKGRINLFGWTWKQYFTKWRAELIYGQWMSGRSVDAKNAQCHGAICITMLVIVFCFKMSMIFFSFFFLIAVEVTFRFSLLTHYVLLLNSPFIYL